MRNFVVLDRIKKMAEVVKAYVDSASLKITEATLKSLSEIQNKLIPSGGTTGQLLMKKSNSDHDVEWGGYVSNDNLLDNWYFANPINQRGETDYTKKGYAIDRMYIEKGSIFVLENGVNFAKDGVYFQRIDNELSEYLKGKIVTLSLLTTDNHLYTASANALNFSSGNAPFGEFKVGYYSGDTQGFRLLTTKSDVALVAAKLELGPIQTLAHKEGDVWVLNDSPPNKALELAKCQRYQLIFHKGSYPRIRAAQYSNDNIWFFIPTPVSLRGNPTIINSNVLRVYTYAAYTTPQDGFTFSTVYSTPSGVFVGGNKPSHGLTEGFLYGKNDEGDYFGLDSNL